MKITVIKTLAILLAVTVIGAGSQAYSQQAKRQTIEQAYFKVVEIPKRGARGALEVFLPDDFGDGICDNCGGRYKFDDRLLIRVAGETSSMSHEMLAQLPQQLAYVVIEGDQVITIGFNEIILPDRIANDL